MSPVKVVHLSSVHARYDNRILLKQCVSLVNSGFEVFLVIADGLGNENFSGVKIIDVGPKTNLFQRVFFIAKKVYKKALEINGDIYQIHDPELIPKGLKLVKRGKKVIYDIHEDYVTGISQKKYLPNFIKGPLALFWEFYERKASRKFKVIIAEKYYKERFPDSIEILNFPILPEVPVKIRKHKAPLKPKLIYSGNITEVRGAFTQLSLLDKFSILQLTYIGFCSEHLAKIIEEKAKSNLKRFELIGTGKFVPFKQIVEKYVSEDWLAGIAIFPKTKHYEKKELTKFFEYMSYGLPILCSDFPHWKSFVEKYDCGIAIDPFNYEGINMALNRLINDNELHFKMALNGQNAVYKYFNWANEEEKLLGLYFSLVHEK
jgi:glycosyltransferase involved in cell wall biosynthesis